MPYLFINNLANDSGTGANRIFLRKLFSSHGSCRKIYVPERALGPLTYAKVWMSDEDVCEDIVSHFNGKSYQPGLIISIAIAGEQKTREKKTREPVSRTAVRQPKCVTGPVEAPKKHECVGAPQMSKSAKKNQRRKQKRKSQKKKTLEKTLSKSPSVSPPTSPVSALRKSGAKKKGHIVINDTTFIKEFTPDDSKSSMSYDRWAPREEYHADEETKKNTLSLRRTEKVDRHWANNTFDVHYRGIRASYEMFKIENHKSPQVVTSKTALSGDGLSLGKVSFQKSKCHTLFLNIYDSHTSIWWSTNDNAQNALQDNKEADMELIDDTIELCNSFLMKIQEGSAVILCGKHSFSESIVVVETMKILEEMKKIKTRGEMVMEAFALL